MASEVYHGSDMGHTPELKLEGEGDQAKACGSIECAEHWSLLPWDRSYHSPGWGLELPPWSSHSGRQAGLPRAVPTLPSPARSQRGGLTREMRLESVRASETSTLSPWCAGRSSLL